MVNTLLSPASASPLVPCDFMQGLRDALPGKPQGHHGHLTEEKAEAQRGEVTWARSQPWRQGLSVHQQAVSSALPLDREGS